MYTYVKNLYYHMAVNFYPVVSKEEVRQPSIHELEINPPIKDVGFFQVMNLRRTSIHDISFHISNYSVNRAGRLYGRIFDRSREVQTKRSEVCTRTVVSKAQG